MNRHFFVVFLSCYTELSLAAADWNCEKNEAGEWACVTQLPAGQQKKQPSAASKAAPPVPEQPAKPVSVPEVLENTPTSKTEADLPEESTAAVEPVNKAVSPLPATQTVSMPEPMLPKVAKTKKIATQNAPEVSPKTQRVKKLASVAAASAANENLKPDSWNCEKNTAGDWDCGTPQAGQQKQPVSVAPVTPEPPLNPVPLPVIVENTPALKTETDLPLKSTLKTTKTKKAVVKDEPEVVPKIQLAQNPMPLSAAPPQGVNQEGWNCAPNEENSTWDCQLVGENPKGEAKIIADEDDPIQLLSPAFTAKQERAFKTLRKEFPFDPWQQCSAPRQPKQKLVPKKGLRETSPLEIESNYSEVFDKEVSNFTGNVDMTRADQHLTADMASYDSVANQMDTQGNVYYSEDGLALFSNTATLKLAADKSILRDVLFESLSGPYRGSAEVAYKDNKTLSHYKQAAYTSCAPGNQDWVIHTSRLKINKDSGEGSATNAWLEFKGVPLAYTPYISFPTDDRRKTGLLPISLGNSSRSGVQFVAPFYWNIEPNYDALFKPRYLSKRGLLLDANFRYLTEITKGSVGIEYMPYDHTRKISRFSGVVKNATTFSPNLSTNLDLNYVSDKDYFYELGNALSFTNRSYLLSRADVNYHREGVSFLTSLQSYETIDNTVPQAARPYQKLPQVELNLNHRFKSMPIDLAMGNEYVYFYRKDRVNGQRFNTKPSITFPIKNAGAFITPKFSVQYTQYLLQNQDLWKNYVPSSNPTANVSRVSPIASLDTGLFLEQGFKVAETSLLHTIEPRIFYLYVPRSNQDNIPVFDSALYDFTFASLFRENRFSGNDRVQDANQISLALTSRLLDSDSGREYLNLKVGQQLYFRDRKVTLAGYVPATNRLSNLVTELNGSLNEHFSFSGGMQWDPYANDFTRKSARIQFMNDPDQIINIGYLYRKDQVGLTVPIGQPDPRTGKAALNGDIVSISQTDVSFRWPVYDDWYLMGRWLYALNFKATTDSFIGLEKNNCCWRFSIIGRRFANNLNTTGYIGSTNTFVNTSLAPTSLQTGIFVQLELKGLGSFGDDIESFLKRNIPGYTKTP